MTRVTLFVCVLFSNTLFITSEYTTITLSTEVTKKSCQTSLDSCQVTLGGKPMKIVPTAPGSKDDADPVHFKGEKGNPGPQGERGLRGPPGRLGSCPCTYEEVVIYGGDDDPSDEEFGSYNESAAVVCKDAPKDADIKSGNYYYMGPGKVKVTCEARDDGNMWTCIPPVGDPLIVEYDREPFWLSSKGLTLEKMYNLTRAQITWLQERSNSVHQTIKYHCYNSIPYIKNNSSSSLKIFSYNDIPIGPAPSETVPLTYSVSTELPDDCSNVKDKNSSSLIKLQSNVVHRLPAVDFLIQDISADVKQTVGVEHVELCFY